MADFHIAKLFKNGGSQAVRLPVEFRFEGDRVRVRRLGKAVVIEPVVGTADELFALLDSIADPEPVASP